MAKRKIVYIAQSAGGVAEYLYMFFKNFNNDSYENILIVSQDYEEQIDRFKNLVSEIFFIPMRREIDIGDDLKSIRNVKKLLKLIKPDIVYLHSSKAGAIGRIALAFNFKVKILYNAHGWYFNAQISNQKKRIFAIIEKILAIKTNKIINISKNEYESALKYKIASKKKMCIIENGIDFTKFRDIDKYRKETRKKYAIEENEILIGVVGRLSEQKDPMTMIKAFERIHKEKNNTTLMYVGSGELEELVVEYAKNKNILDKIIISGWTNNVEKYIPAFDIAVLPSKWEGFGLVLIEYMACEKPIIASNVGGIKNIIDNFSNGILFQSNNVEELSRSMLEYIDNKELREKVIKNNNLVREKYDINIVIQKHEKLFNEIF